MPRTLGLAVLILATSVSAKTISYRQGAQVLTLSFAPCPVGTVQAGNLDSAAPICIPAPSAALAFGPCATGQYQSGNLSPNGAPICKAWPTSTTITTTTASVVSTTLAAGPLGPFVVNDAVGGGREEVDVGSGTLMGWLQTWLFGDNTWGAFVIRRDRHYGETGWFSLFTRGMAQWGIGSVGIGDQGDEPGLVQYGTATAPQPNPPVVALKQNTAGKYWAGWNLAFTAVGFDTRTGGFGAPSLPNYQTCAAPGPCSAELDWPTSYPTMTWNGHPLEVVIFVGDGGHPPSWQWLLDRVWPTKHLSLLDMNGELPTLNQINVSGEHLFEIRGSEAGWAPKFAPGMALDTWESVLGPPLAANLPTVTDRYLMDGVHCDADCQVCQVARGISTVTAASPPIWSDTYEGHCDPSGNRYRKVARVGVTETVQAPVGRCAAVFETIGQRPTLGICDPDGRGMTVCNLKTGTCL